MLVSVNNQAYIFLYIVLGGMFIGLIYDFFRVARKIIKTKNIIVHFQDILFWIMVSTLIFGILFVCNGGEIRGYSFVAILLGVIIYELVFSNYVILVLLKIIDILTKIIRLLYKIISIPLIFIFRIIYLPVRFLYFKVKKLSRFIKKINSMVVQRITLNVRNLKNTIKKY